MDKQFKEQKHVGEYFYRFKDGESGADVHSRISIFLQYLFRRILSIDYHAWHNVIIVSHALTIKVFMMNFLNLSVKEFDNLGSRIIVNSGLLKKMNSANIKLKIIFLRKKKNKLY